jgi:hypothetical protein
LANGNGEIVWTTDVPMMTDRFHLWDFLKVSVLSVVIAGLLVACTGWLLDGDPVFISLRILGMVAGGFFASFLVVSLCMGNKYRVTFGLSRKGVSYESAPRERRLGRLAALAGGFANSPTAAGAGLLATSREALVVAWEDVRSVRVYPGSRVIVVKNSWRTLLRLYCPPHIFAQASAAAVEFHREFGPPEADTTRGRGTSWPYRVGWFVAAALLTWGSQSWYWSDHEVLARLGIVGGGLVAVSGLLPGAARQVAGFVGAGLVLAHGGGLVASSLEPFGDLFGISRTVVLDTPWLVVAGVCTALLVISGGWSAVGRGWGSQEGPAEPQG